MSAPGRSRGAALLGPLPLIVVFGAFVALAAAKVECFGLCCADDGYFASTAKNVAAGLGYGTTVHGEGFRPFDPEISTGPPVILPAALATALLGNRYWVPGAVAIAVWVLLLVAIHRGLRRREGVRNLSLAAGVFLAGVVLLFPYHFEHWFALLGEVPAALLLLLGLVLLARSELSTRAIALAALSCGLAFLTKMVSALFCAAFFVGLAARVLAERRGWRELLRHGLVAAAAFAAPIVAFELWKLVALGGPGAWRQHLAQTAAFMRTQGAPASARGARWARALEYDRAVAARFGISVWQLAGVSLAASVALFRLGGPVQRRLALPLLVGVLLSSTWFLFRSIGWPRYVVVTLLLAWALIVLLLTALRRTHAAALAAVLLLALLAVNHRKLPQLALGFEGGLFSRSPQLASALELASFIDAKAGEVPFANQWWATTADLEYYSRSVNVFTKYPLVDRSRPYYVVFKRAFKYEGDPEFNRLIAECEPAERAFEPYAVLKCGR